MWAAQRDGDGWMVDQGRVLQDDDYATLRRCRGTADRDEHGESQGTGLVLVHWQALTAAP